MSTLDMMKTAATVLKEAGRLDLHEELMTARETMLDLRGANADLKEENAQLKDRLALQDELTFRDDAYWRGEEGPFCSSCWDAKGTLVHLHTQGKKGHRCPVCDRYIGSDPKIRTSFGTVPPIRDEEY